MEKELIVSEWIEKNAQDTARCIRRNHERKGEVCAIYLATISKEDIAAKRYYFTQSKASGTSYICLKCANGSK